MVWRAVSAQGAGATKADRGGRLRANSTWLRTSAAVDQSCSEGQKDILDRNELVGIVCAMMQTDGIRLEDSTGEID